MKKDIHPNSRNVVFRDISTGFSFVTESSVKTKETVEFEGKEYPLYTVEISSDSHPFYTGQQKIMDTEGRIDRFNKKYAGFSKRTVKTPAAE